MHTLKHESRSNLKLEKSIKKFHYIIRHRAENMGKQMNAHQQPKYFDLNNSTHTHRGVK